VWDEGEKVHTVHVAKGTEVDDTREGQRWCRRRAIRGNVRRVRVLPRKGTFVGRLEKRAL
jgi:hypothetical protein